MANLLGLAPRYVGLNIKLLCDQTKLILINFSEQRNYFVDSIIRINKNSFRVHSINERKKSKHKTV